MIDRASLPDSELPATGNPRFQLSPLSRRPAASHPKFKRRMTFPFELPGDPEERRAPSP
jgi:hypothetical protein